MLAWKVGVSIKAVVLLDSFVIAAVLYVVLQCFTHLYILFVFRSEAYTDRKQQDTVLQRFTNPD